MADDNPNRPRTLGGNNASDPAPSSWPRPAASAPRIGRIGGWGGGGSTCVSYHITVFISLTKLLYSVCIYSGGGGGGGSGRRFATLGGDDSDDGDDEPQNYFAGGERR
jgi:hypothetical protein